MSIKHTNNKFTLINQRIKYGTDGGINVKEASLYSNPSNGRIGINTINPQYTFDVSGNIRFTELADGSNLIGTNTQVLTQVNNKQLWSYYDYQMNGENMIPNLNVLYSFLPNYVAPNQGWFGSVLALNNKIYTTPYLDRSTIVIDTMTDTWLVQPLPTTTLNLSSLCIGGVCASNGKIYMGSISASIGGVTYILVNDVPNNRFYNITINLQSLASGYAGCCLGPNGKIYFVPRFADNVLVINPVDDSYYFITSPDVNLSLDRKWMGSVLGLNGKIYCMPARATSILVIDTLTDTMSASIPTLSGFPVSTDEGKYWSGALAPNGKIYSSPQNSVDISAGSRFLEIDPSTDTYQYVGPSYSGTRKYSGGTLGLDGNIYYFSDNIGNAIRFNPNNYSVTSINTLSRLWTGTLAPNGKIYAYPRQGSGTPSNQLNAVRIIETGIPSQQPWMLAPEFNKY
jgi:hypothetical protein